MKKLIVFYLLILLFFLTSCGEKSQNSNVDDQLEEKSNQAVEIDDTGQNLNEVDGTSIKKDQMKKEEPVVEENPKVEENDVEEKKDAYYVDAKNFIRPVAETGQEEKIVLLTIDDAPAGESTTTILDILDKYNAKAIWFVNGYYADKNRELLKEIHERGHLIGNHTWWHKKLTTLNPQETREEIVSINDLVEEVTGVRPTYFRAPFGVNSETAYEVLKNEKMQAMNWTWGSLDWELKKPEEIEKNVIEHVHNGANILFHDKEITAEALDNILKALSDKGYHFVLPTEVHIKE